MNINFLNCCRYAVSVAIGSGSPVEIQPHCTVSIPCEKSDTLNISVKLNTNSQVAKGKYTLVLETKYVFTNISDNDTFSITREKVRVGSDVYYDRLFLSAKKATYLSETHSVLDSEKMKKAYNKSRLIKFLLISPIEEPGMFIVLLILGIVLSCYWGWKLAVIYFPLAYIFLLALQWLTASVFKQILNKGLKIDDETQMFFNCFENEHIMSYYFNPNRTPFLDDIEIN